MGCNFFPSLNFLHVKRPSHIMVQSANSLPNDKILDWSKLKTLADDKIKVTEELNFVLGKRKHFWKRRNCSLRAISPFLTVCSKGFFYMSVGILWLRVNPLRNDKFLDWTKFRSISRRQFKCC